LRIIAFIDDYKVIRKILDYLGIYEYKVYIDDVLVAVLPFEVKLKDFLLIL